MSDHEVAQLGPGDEVWWDDPADDECSRYYTISSIEVNGDTVCIADKDGSYLECYAEELR